MSEALEKRDIRDDYPAEAPPQRIDIRRAMAGIYHLQGHGSMYRCAVKAGFSRSTARKLLQNGITAERCVAEAAKLDPMLAPAKLLESGRRRLAESMAFIDPATVPLRDVVRMFEATEKYFGGHQISPVNTALSMADRLAGLVSYLVVARERGLPVPELPREYVEAQIVKDAITTNAQAIETKGDNERASGNPVYVASEKHETGAPLPHASDESIRPRPDICPNY